MKELAIYTAGVIGYGGILASIALMILALKWHKWYLGPYSIPSPYPEAAIISFFIGAAALLIMFAIVGV